MLDIELPVYNELHAKVTLHDSLRAFPRYADLLVWNDAQSLPWTDAERASVESNPAAAALLESFPGGVHYLPKGTSSDPKIMALWTYDIRPSEYIEPPAIAPHYAEIVLRGLARMVPRASQYFGLAHRVTVDGGYYCKTPENRPLIGPLPIQGAYIIGALSGFGVMASQGAADLLAAHVTGSSLPTYADSFLVERYQDAVYLDLLKNWDARSGQL
jgi:glycine/D-amino acid oxidase-like deaminating enzyme